jgi:hypothetical protein
VFYNPAALAWARFQVGLLGIELNASANQARVSSSQDDVNKDSSAEKVDVEQLYKLLNSEDPLYVGTTVRALEITAPYFSVASFINNAQTSRKVNDVDTPFYDMRSQLDIGLIAGVAIRYKKFSVGYSQYLLLRAALVSQPNESEFSTIRGALEDGSFGEDTIDYRSFTNAEYGGTRGSNIGLLYRFWEDNPTAIGLSVLNVGASRFKANAPIEREDFKKTETQMIEAAANENIDLRLPNELPQIVNVGANLGWGGDQSEDILVARASVDAHDVSGDVVSNKLAASFELGIQLPDKLALLASTPINPSGNKGEGSDNGLHIGFLGATAYGGIRPGQYRTSGANIAFHMGYKRAISLLRLDLDYYSLEPIGPQSTAIQAAGLRAVLGLTLIY